MSSTYYVARPSSRYHVDNIHQTIALNNQLNAQAQAAIDAMEPANIWGSPAGQQPFTPSNGDSKNGEKAPQYAPPPGPPPGAPAATGGSADASLSKAGKRSSGFFSKLLKSAPKVPVGMKDIEDLAPTILEEEAARWPDVFTRQIVMIYQDKVGMTKKIVDLRQRHPIQYLHLLRGALFLSHTSGVELIQILRAPFAAGYFEPIPTHWSDQASNPLKFSIEPAGGWRGVTPAWRGYEDTGEPRPVLFGLPLGQMLTPSFTAEERLYWVLNHREGISTVRMKPDFISEVRRLHFPALPRPERR